MLVELQVLLEYEDLRQNKFRSEETAGINLGAELSLWYSLLGSSI